VAAITPVKTGVWSDPTAWSTGTIPVFGDSVTINGGLTITVDADINVGTDPGAGAGPAALSINGGTLTFDTTASRTCTFRGDVQIAATTNSKLLIGTSAAPVPASTIITFKFNDAPTPVIGKYGIYTGAAWNNATVNPQPVIQMYGATKTVATTIGGAGTLAIGSTIIPVASTTGWQVGDEIILGQNSNVTTAADRRTILSVDSSTQVTVTAATTFIHSAGNRVLNITRNIRMTPSTAAFQSFGNFRVSTPGNVVFSYVQIQRMAGQFNNGATGDSSNSQSWGIYGLNAVGTFDGCTFTDSIGQGALRLFNCTNTVSVTNCITWAALGLSLHNSAAGNTISNCYFAGISGVNLVASGFSSGGISNTINNCEFFGGSAGFLTSSGFGTVLNNCSFYCNSTAFGMNSGTNTAMQVNSCSFGVGPMGNQTNVVDINITSASANTVTFDNCTFAGVTLISGTANLLPGSMIGLSRTGGVASNNKTYYAYAVTSQATDQLYSGTSYSLKVQPQNAAQPQSFAQQVVATAGQPVAVTGYMYIDSNYGASTLPSIVLSGAGLTTNTWTAANTPNTWQQFIVSGTPTQNTLANVTFTVQAGSTANVWIGNVVVAGVSVNTGQYGYWFNGSPVSLLLSTGLGAVDIWNVPTSSLTAAGTTGKQVKDSLTVGKFLGLK
jgi:hypothetical protein